MTTIAYHRGPRPAVPEVPRDPVIVRTPPPLEDTGRLLRILQVVAPLAAAGTGLVFIVAYRQQGSLPFIAMGAAIGIGVLVGVLTAVVQSRVATRRRRRAQQRYLEYLDSVRHRLDSLLHLQHRHEAAVVPEREELLRRVRERQRLFEGRPLDADFLEMRAGTGAVPSPAPVALQDVDPLGPDLDPELLRAAKALVARYEQRDSGPRTVAMRAAGTIVVRGDAAGVRGLTRSILTQAAVLHSPDELRIAVIGDKPAVDAHWDWIKWLPHARRDEQSHRIHCATDAPSAGTMLREVRASTSAGGAPAHVLLVVDDWSPGSELAPSADLSAVLSGASTTPVSVLCLVHGQGGEPADLNRRIVVESHASARIEDAGGRVDGAVFQPETLTADAAAEVARMLAPLSSGGDVQHRESPAPPSVAHAMGLRSVEELDVARTWRTASASLLEAPMGTTPDGRPLVLDLKEFAQGGMGPHGMLVGAPGAGKSELLRTLVSALAAAHPPDLLAFVLVDFKGGAAFQPLARMPHVAGIVTNLEDDRSMVERFRLAVEGEVTRRQAVFRAAGNVPDIRTYQWRQASDPDLEPLPYLWLVVDEFAELLANFPDFDTFFEGVARLGRGLGIHLLLATQGVSSGLSRLDRYLSYRIALRTNSVAESMAVLGTNAAARLPLVPGLGYLKVGQTEAEAFTAYHVSEPVAGGSGGADVAPTVRVFKATARGRDAPPETTVNEAAKAPHTQLDVIVDRVLASGAPRAHPVWVTPLPRVLPLDSVLGDEERPLVVALGLADLPLEQRQFRWGIDFAGQDGHVAVVGAPRTGRSTALRTIVSSFLLTHDPEDAQFYIIDMGGALQPLSSAPHVGAVAGKNEPELARRMLRFLARAIDERDAQLRRMGIGSIGELRALRRNGHRHDGLGDLFLIVDNWGAATKAFDWIDDEVTALAGVGLSYGVHVVLSADRWGDIRPGLRDRIPGRLQLRPIEAGDSIVDARTTRTLTNTPGRALVPAGYQLQLALPRVDGVADTADADGAFRDLVARSARNGRPAQRVQLLPDVVPLDGFDWARWRGSGTVPIGIDDSDLQPVTLDLFSPDVQHLLVAGDSRCGKTSFLRAYMEAVTRVRSPGDVQFHIVDIRRGLLDAAPEQYIAAHAMSAADVEALVAGVQEILRTRVAPAGANRRELAERSHVSGPELVLVIDDDDIVDSYALRPLVASIAVAWDMKFHVVLARRPANAPFDGIAAALVSAGAVCLEMNEANRSLVRSRPLTLPPGRAHLLDRSEQPVLVQLIHPSAGDERPAEVEEATLEHAG